MHDQLKRQEPPFATKWKPLPQESINYDLWTHKDVEEYGYEHESKNTAHNRVGQKKSIFPATLKEEGQTALQTRVGNWKGWVGIGGTVDKSVFFFQRVMPWDYTWL